MEISESMSTSPGPAIFLCCIQGTNISKVRMPSRIIGYSLPMILEVPIEQQCKGNEATDQQAIHHIQFHVSVGESKTPKHEHRIYEREFT